MKQVGGLRDSATGNDVVAVVVERRRISPGIGVLRLLRREWRLLRIIARRIEGLTRLRLMTFVGCGVARDIEVTDELSYAKQEWNATGQTGHSPMAVDGEEQEQCKSNG